MNIFGSGSLSNKDYSGSALPLSDREKQIYNNAIEDCLKQIADRCAVSQEAFEAVRKLKK